MRRSRQLVLTLHAPTRWGGRRPGAGRKPRTRPPIAHRSRPAFPARHPAHVTLKLRAGVPSLRSVALVRVLERSLARGCERDGFRVIHYSFQSNHAHLVVEAANRTALARGMKSVGTRLARAVNRVFGRRGPVLAERYHLRVLRTSREVRNVLRYVLLNARKHARHAVPAGLDPASSARWFDGWVGGTDPRSPPSSAPRPIGRARTWLLSVGWRRWGLLDPNDAPRNPRRQSTERYTAHALSL